MKKNESIKSISTNNPNEVFICFSNDEIFKYTSISDMKYNLIVLYFRKYLTGLGQVNFTLNKLATECGYKTGTNYTMFDDFRQTIQSFIDEGFATISEDIMTVKPNKLLTISFNYDNCPIFGHEINNFTKITISEFNKITSLSSNDLRKTNPAILMAIYIYLKKFIYEDSNNVKVQLTYPSHLHISKELNVDIKTVSMAIDTLVNNKIIFKKTYKVFKDNGTKPILRNVYALDKKYLSDDDSVIYELSRVYDKTVKIIPTE